MEASQRKLSAAVVIILLVMDTEMTAPVQAGECLSKSTTFTGWCLDSGSYNDKCLQESNAYSGGKCRGIQFTCWCITPCATTTLLAAARRPHPPTGGAAPRRPLPASPGRLG